MLISGAVHNCDHATMADAFLPKGASSPLEMLERVRVMVARKRGPRKQVPRPEAQSAALLVQAPPTQSLPAQLPAQRHVAAS